MSKLITIKNEKIECVISTHGAEIQSVKKDGKEFIWEGDPAVWSGRSPVLFPICGGLKEDKYTYSGKEYSLKKHGFARHSEFETEEITESRAVFLLKSSAETKRDYPFDFEFRVSYTLSENEITVEYAVKNTGDSNLYYSVGAHEAYACPEGIEEYSVLFDGEENLVSSVLNGNLLSETTVSVGENIRELPLKYEFFKVDALVFLDVKSRRVSLLHKGEKVVDVEFGDMDYLLLWTKPNGKYICIEPWCGVPDFEGSSFDITKKRGIIEVAPNSINKKIHTLKF